MGAVALVCALDARLGYLGEEGVTCLAVSAILTLAADYAGLISAVAFPVVL